MCRNLRVKRELLKWRQEGNSYVSLIPMDILTLILPYLPPDIWKEKARAGEIWSIDFPPKVKYEKWYTQDLKTCFLSDGSVVLGYELNQPQIIYLEGRVVPRLNENVIERTQLHADQDGGFWYSVRIPETQSLMVHHDHLSVEKQRKCLYLWRVDRSWSEQDFAILEDGSCYILYRGTERGNAHTSLLVRYSSDGTIEFKYQLFSEYERLEYQEGRLYLIGEGERYVINYPTAPPEEIKLQLGEKDVNSYNIDMWMAFPTIRNHGKIPAVDFAGPDGRDIFYITKNGNPGIYLLTPGGWDDSCLWGFPEGMKGLKLRLLPNGEIHYLTQQGDKISLFRLY